MLLWHHVGVPIGDRPDPQPRLTPARVVEIVLGSVASVFGWMVAIAFGSLFLVSALSASTSSDVLSWLVNWAMGNGIRGGMSSGAVFALMIWNAMLSAGMWQLMAVLPVWRINRILFGEPTRQLFVRMALVLGVIVLLNPRGLLRGDELPFLLNLDALTWFPAAALLGRTLDAQFFGRHVPRAGFSAPTRDR